MRNSIALGLLWFVGQGCGEADEKAPESAATPADIVAWCDAACDFGQRCAREDDLAPAEATGASSCAAECRSEADGLGELVQRRVAHAFAECFRELSCASSDDACVGRVVEELGLEVTPLAMRCLEVQDDCGGFSDDFCTYTVTATSQGRERIDDCLGLACDGVPACLEALGG